MVPWQRPNRPGLMEVMEYVPEVLLDAWCSGKFLVGLLSNKKCCFYGKFVLVWVDADTCGRFLCGLIPGGVSVWANVDMQVTVYAFLVTEEPNANFSRC